jgi:hypothetical protein
VPEIDQYKDSQRNFVWGNPVVLKAGTQAYLLGKNFGPPGGTMRYGLWPVVVTAWSDVEIGFIVPLAGSTFNPLGAMLTVTRLDGAYYSTMGFAVTP